MFQRFLSMVLCTCLIAGSVPDTSYAATPNEGTQTEVVAEVSTEEAQLFVETGEGSGEMETVVETGETEAGETETAMESEVETEAETGETETVVETEVETSETEATAETEEATVEAETAMETEEETETVPGTEMESEVMESVEETTEPEETMKEPVVEQATTEDTALTLGTQQVSVTTTSWFVFTAPEKGNYCIHVKTDEALKVELFVGSKSIMSDQVWCYGGGSHNFVMPREMGDTLYVRVTWTDSTAANLTMTVSKIPEVVLTETGAGTYKVVCGDYIVDITMDIGYRSMKANVALSANNGAALASTYKLEYRLGTRKTYQTINLTGNTYQSTISQYNLDMNKDYSLQMNLLDSEGNILAVLGKPYLYSYFDYIEFTTGQTDEEIVLNIGEPTYKTVEVEYEKIENATMYCYYAPLTAPEKVNSISLGIGKTTTLLKNLKPDTDYRLWVEYADGTLVCEKSLQQKR